MDHPRRKLLAAAGFAVDENRCLTLRQPVDHAAYELHRRRIAEQLIAGRRLDLFGHLERLLDECAELLESDRLRQIIECARLESRYRVLRTAESRDDRDRHVERFLSDVFDNA